MAYPTLAQLKTLLGVSGDTLNTQLTQCLNAAIAFVEEYCNMSFVQTQETRSFAARWPYVFAAARRLETYEWFDTVTAITNGDGVAITAYNLVPANGPQYHAVELKPTATAFNDGGDGTLIQIAATWDVDTPDDIFKVVMDIAGFEYQQTKQGAGGQAVAATRGSGLTVLASSLPEHVYDVLNLHRRAG